METSILKKYFTLDANVKRLENAPVIRSPILDNVYPEDKRTEYPASIVKKTDLPAAIKNVPVIVRGTQAYNIKGSSTSYEGYEPFPVEMSKRIPAADMSDIRGLTGESQELYVSRIIETLRQSSHATAEALAAQSLTGKIAYPVSGSEGSELYEVDFGKTKEVSVSKKFDAAGISVADVIEEISTMGDMVSVNGYGQSILCLAGRKAFSAIVKLLMQNKSNLSLAVSEGKIGFPGFTLMRIGSSYHDYTTKTDKQSVPDKRLCTIAVDAPFWLPYCAIDDFGAGLMPLPFFSSIEEIKNPSALDVFGKSKPFPVPVVDCICWTDDVVS